MRMLLRILTGLTLLAWSEGFTIPTLAMDSPPATASKPNVLFIAVDDLNDWIGALGGHPQTRTPHIDRLAARGMLFQHAYCAAPACNPSRAALLTGVRPSTSGVYHNNQPWRPALKDAVTLPQHFMRNGYRVTGGGKIFHGRYKDPASWQHYEPSAGDPRPTQEVLRDPHSRAGGIIWGELDVDDQAMGDYGVVSWAIKELARPHENPFFLACGIYRPHMPWQVPRKYYDLFPVGDIVLPEVMEDDLGDVPPPGVSMARRGDHARILETDNWKRAVQAYLASIAFADAQVGRLLDALDHSPHRDNTIVVLWGDHGWHLGEKRHWRKFALWEQATRAPLIFVVPGVTKPGQTCAQPVDFMNIYPTLAELCGLPVEAGLEGVSMTSLLRNPQSDWERAALTTHGWNNHAVRWRHWRYIRYADGSEELYDHRHDPHEWSNLAKDAGHAGIIESLRRHLPRVNAPDALRQNARAGNRNR